ncbi:MAG: HEAT repeat domain-containing protein, partial [Methanoregulaceae archaeon]|nr:HEAT repeat domain-containing protein [Methanoregulaceae archaeon]
MGVIKSLKARFGSGREEGAESDQGLADNVQRALTYGDVDDRWGAIRAVGELGSPFVAPLIRALQDEYWIIRRGAANTLGKIGAPAVGPLIEALDQENEDVRQEIFRALALIGPPSHGMLIHAVSHDNVLIR